MNNRILTTLFALALCLFLFIGVVPVEADAADACAHATYETIYQKNANCTETGIKLTYDRCLNCGKAFSDAAHTKEVNPDYLVTPDLGGHKWQTISDATTHWEKCSVCGTERNVVAHTANGWVQTSADHKQVCTVCNATLPNTQGVHVSVYKDSGDGKNHHAECKYCGYVTGADVAHTFTSTSYAKKDEKGHTATCSGCGIKVVQEHVDADAPSACAISAVNCCMITAFMYLALKTDMLGVVAYANNLIPLRSTSPVSTFTPPARS